MDSYITVSKYGRYEYEDKKSLFIGEAMPVGSEAEAIAFIEKVKKTYPDARHHVYAYVLRENSIARFTDDSEPQGTAGMPTLDAIRKNGCVDVVIVVTRYFGGTLLGTGGLVRAYTQAAIGAMNDAGIVTYDVYSTVEITVSYSDHGRIAGVLLDNGFTVDDTAFADSVRITGRIRATEYESLKSKLIEATSTRALIQEKARAFDYI